MADLSNDPLFRPVSAKPKSEEERHQRRVTEAASHAGKAWRGTRTGHKWGRWWPAGKTKDLPDARS